MGAIEECIQRTERPGGDDNLPRKARAELAEKDAENARLIEALDDIAKFGRDNSGCGFTCSKKASAALSGAPATKEQENPAKHKDTLRRGDIASRLVSEWLEEYVREDDVYKDILLHLEGDAARSALCELEVRIMDALSVSKDAVSPRGAWLSAAQLREIEWAAEGCDVRGGEVTAYAACPACGGAHPLFEPNQPSRLGHATDCWLADKIKQAEEKA